MPFECCKYRTSSLTWEGAEADESSLVFVVFYVSHPEMLPLKRTQKLPGTPSGHTYVGPPTNLLVNIYSPIKSIFSGVSGHTWLSLEFLG